jgi:hypothetical protein
MAGRLRAGRRATSSFDFFAAIRTSRWLAAYLLAGPLATLYLLAAGYGTRFLVAALINLAMLALYAGLTSVLAGSQTQPVWRVSRPGLELAAVLGLCGVLALRGIGRLDIVDLGAAGATLRQADVLVISVAEALANLLPLTGDDLAALTAALLDCFWLLLLPGTVFLALGYRPAGLGFNLSLWWLAAPLVAITGWPVIVDYLASGILAWPATSALAVAGALLAGLAWEFFYRGLLFTRLEAGGLGTARALVAAALGQALVQLPDQLAANGYDVVLTLAGTVAFPAAPAALAWGYVFLRSRGLAPGALWHASPWAAFPFV